MKIQIEIKLNREFNKRGDLSWTDTLWWFEPETFLDATFGWKKLNDIKSIIMETCHPSVHNYHD